MKWSDAKYLNHPVEILSRAQTHRSYPHASPVTIGTSAGKLCPRWCIDVLNLCVA